MGFSETEKTEQKLPMNPAAVENGGIISNGRTKQGTEVISMKLESSVDGLYNNGKEKSTFNVRHVSLALNVFLIVFIIAISITLLGRSRLLPPALPSPSIPTECCPDGWIGYQRNCYYFSESEGNWKYSQNYCASFNASLVMIDSQEEMSFLRRHKGPADHWIGLQRMNEQEPWKWINGTIFNEWFEIREGGKYAYMNHEGVASSSGRRDEPWICSKPVHK